MSRFIFTIIVISSLCSGCIYEDDETLLYRNPFPSITSDTATTVLPDTIPQIKSEIQIKRATAFRNSLEPDLLKWTFEYPDLYSIIVNEFIADYTPRNEFIAYSMIRSMAYNNNYSGDDFMADGDESNIPYSGNLVFIPKIIRTNGCATVVYFGSTFSDGENAQQMVSAILLEGLESGLEKVNSVLPEKIKSIEIKCTSNGTHALTSNHYNKTALDITKINGHKIADIRFENLVYELQDAFDQYPQIRENFGPAFKHKTEANGSKNANYSIPGHFDHIHISVQSN